MMMMMMMSVEVDLPKFDNLLRLYRTQIPHYRCSATVSAPLTHHVGL